MSIYTRTGDKGETSLFGGKRVLKCAELVDAYGSIDELNSWIGLVSSQLSDDPTVHTFLNDIQRDLFTIGSSLAGWKANLSTLPKQVTKMEQAIDEMEKDLPQLTNFILPGGSQLGAQVHLARAVCRRVERQTVKLMQTNPVDKRIVTYLNRLSDLLFVLSRFINKKLNIEEIVWSGIGRTKKT